MCVCEREREREHDLSLSDGVLRGESHDFSRLLDSMKIIPRRFLHDRDRRAVMRTLKNLLIQPLCTSGSGSLTRYLSDNGDYRVRLPDPLAVSSGSSGAD